MSRAYNFSAGPATLPEPVLLKAQAEMLEFGKAGASIVELSHRGPEFLAVAQQTEADLRTLLSIPDDYAVIFTAGMVRSRASPVILASCSSRAKPSPRFKVCTRLPALSRRRSEMWAAFKRPSGVSK